MAKNNFVADVTFKFLLVCITLLSEDYFSPRTVFASITPEYFKLFSEINKVIPAFK